MKTTQARIDGETDPDRKERWEHQLRSYQQQIAQIERQLGAMQAGSGTTHDLRGEEVQLSARIVDHAATREVMDKAKEKMSTVAGDQKLHLAPHRVPPSSKYAGAEACASCHPSQTAQWLTTGHATAYQSLVDVKSHMDDTCWFCHVTGGRQATGPQQAVEVRGFRDVQCEACHGPARAHTVDPANAQLRPVRSPQASLCVHCHDGKMDEGRFDFEAYLPKVVHTPPTPGAPP